MRHSLKSFLLQPLGLLAISRWLSAATPPGEAANSYPDPGGCRREKPIKLDALIVDENIAIWLIYNLAHPKKTATPSGSIFYFYSIRGCRCAQPPANGLNPFGVPFAHSGVTVHSPGNAGILPARFAAKMASPPGKDRWSERLHSWNVENAVINLIHRQNTSNGIQIHQPLQPRSFRQYPSFPLPDIPLYKRFCLRH